MKGRPKTEKPPIVVVYKKSTGKKIYIRVFEDIIIDDIIDSRKRRPPLPHNYQILEIGVGKSLIKSYQEQYNIKKVLS